MFTVRINRTNQRIDTGAVEKAIRATFAEVLGEDVHVFVEQSTDVCLCITVDRKDEDFPLVEDCLDPFAEGAEATALADAEDGCFDEGAEATALADRNAATEAEHARALVREEDSATETRAQLEARIRADCANEEAFRRECDEGLEAYHRDINGGGYPE
jgi:hypothetical protein